MLTVKLQGSGRKGRFPTRSSQRCPLSAPRNKIDGRPRRFPPPWSVEEQDAGFVVRDQNGQQLAYVYFEDESGRRSAAKLLTRDEARRIAANIAKLPDFMQPAPDEDEDERTTALGLFNTAEAYQLSAMALQRAEVRHGHANNPVRLLYYHALELYLKALLRQTHSVNALRRRFSHSIALLLREAEALGLAVTDEDREVLALIAGSDAMIEARYIKTGSKTLATLEALNRTCGSIREGVGAILRAKGEPVQL
jgi:hypothetical protein